MHTINTRQSYSLIPDPVYTQIDDEIVVISPKNDQNHAINPTGTVLWRMLEARPVSVEEMVQHIQQIYAVDDEQAMHDALAFIQSMMEHQLVIRTQ